MTLELFKELFDDVFTGYIYAVTIYYCDIGNDVNDGFVFYYNKKIKKYAVKYTEIDDLLYDSFEDFVLHFKFINGKMIPEVLEYLNYVDD